jgi:capsule polysaccharide export protein KpsE/RkpR
MCSAIGKCLDITKLTPKELKCINKFLKQRKAELQKNMRDFQAQMDRVDFAQKRVVFAQKRLARR